MRDGASLVTAKIPHTPGPWLYRPKEYDDWGIVRVAGIDEDGWQRIICQASYFADPDELCAHRANGTDPAEANARLIAAAPELLEIAQEANNALNAMAAQVDAEWRNHDKAQDRHDAIVRAFRAKVRAAISKATQP